MRAAIWLLVALAWSAPAAAQTTSDLIRARWQATVAEVQAARPLETLSDSDKRALYRAVLRRLMRDPALAPVFRPDRATTDALLSERTPDAELAQIAALARAGAGAKSAKSVNASASNPAAPAAAERSGATDLVALALDTRGLLAADSSAVTINLNALALLRLGSPALSAPAQYRQHDTLRRLSGTFTFGAKVPEHEITGISDVPSADDLLDVFAWDVKYRLFGDRDPRAQRWDRLMLGTLGGLAEVLAIAPALVPAADRPLLLAEARDALRLAALAVRDELGRSWQVAIKAAGQHLSTETGRNRQAFTLMADAGLAGDGDLTVNLTYATVDDVTIAPGRAVSLATWSGAIGYNQLVARDLLVEGRATRLSISGGIDLPRGDPAGVDRKRRWHVVGSVALPWGESAEIPLSITFTSDPGRLRKDKVVSGYIGVSYDFGALGSLFKAGQSPTR